MVLTDSKISDTYTNRIFGLDVLRAYAIILVVESHADFLVKNTFLEKFPYISIVDGVDLFFVLSGLLIGTILLKEISQTNTFNFFQLIFFWKRRWFRTLPNYYLILLINVLIVKFHFIPEDINQFSWKFLFFIQNFNYSFHGFFWESWSLSIEEWFYIFMPLILVVFTKFTPAKKAFIISTLLLIIVPFFIRYLKYNPLNEDWNWFELEIKKTVLTRLDSIGYGLAAAWVAFYYPNIFKKYRIHSFVLALLLSYFCGNYLLNSMPFYLQVVSFSINSLAAMLFLPIAYSINSTKGIFVKVITHISKISYSMYLINLAMVSEVIGYNFPVSSTTDGILKYTMYWIIVLSLSTLIFKFYEKPIMNLRNQF